MSIIDKIFGRDDEKNSANPPKPNDEMQKVLDALASLGGKPIETLSPQEARQQPTPTDAVKKIIADTAPETDTQLGVSTRDITIDGATGPLQARVYTPVENNGDPRPLVVYFHGGGFVIADLDVYDGGPRGLSHFGNVIVLSVHYRQAPENKFPAAHDDAVAAWKWAVANAVSLGADPEKIGVAGESAGGNLAINVSIAARDQGLKAPLHQVLVYPVAGNDMETESYVQNADAKPLNKPMMKWFIEHIFHSDDEAADPRINLVGAANLSGLPSTTLLLAEIDPLRTEGELLAQKLDEAGVKVSAKTYDGVSHEFFGMGLVVSEAESAQKLAAHDLKKAFGTAILPF